METTRNYNNLDELVAAIRNGEIELDDNLPTWGSEIEITDGVWSWDETRALVGTCRDDLEIVPRSEVEN